ncbi:MAG: rhamnulokinase [Bacteroidales bacterium]|nr:rhamnulokinase [Bacteroidales bacterium]
MKPSVCLAVDLGATSGRTMLATFDGTSVDLREFTRFENPMIQYAGHRFWDLPALYNEILKALKKAAVEGIGLDSIGIDTWGCDFALFDRNDLLLSLPFSYRDPQTDGAVRKWERRHELRELYDRTGIQIMNFNSIFQLFTIRREHRALWRQARKMFFIPDALIFLLTGKEVCEYTVASTSQMLNVYERDFDEKVLKALRLKRKRLGPMVQPGTVVGYLSEDIRDITGIGKIKVVAVAGHDTASAVAAVPAQNGNFAYLSCGTWSLMGIETKSPIVNQKSFEENFTNEGGVDGTVRFLKNIVGLWILEECRKEFKDAPSDIRELSALWSQSQCDSLINPDNPAFMHPGSMMKAIAVDCHRSGQVVPETTADYVRVIFRSLAVRYREVLEILDDFAPFDIECLNVIGGGSQNEHLMQLTANMIGRPVISGPAECTALGNALMQMKALGHIRDLNHLREVSTASVKTKIYHPHNYNERPVD